MAERRLEQACRQICTQSFQLHPDALGRIGLAASVEKLMADVFVDSAVDWSIEPDMATSALAFRLVAEALSTVVKHFQAMCVNVTIRRRAQPRST